MYACSCETENTNLRCLLLHGTNTRATEAISIVYIMYWLITCSIKWRLCEQRALSTHLIFAVYLNDALKWWYMPITKMAWSSTKLRAQATHLLSGNKIIAFQNRTQNRTEYTHDNDIRNEISKNSCTKRKTARIKRGNTLNRSIECGTLTIISNGISF